MPDIQFIVTVQNVNGSNKYFINEEKQLTILLDRNNTYTFVNSENISHPLKFKDGNGNEYTNITIDGNSIKLLVDDNTPSILQYYCEFHEGMGGYINIVANYEVNFSRSFNGTKYDEVRNMYEFPSSAESSAGFYNTNTKIYSLEFPDGGTISFKAAALNDSVDIRFRFEKDESPNNDYLFDTGPYKINSTELLEYNIDFPPSPPDGPKYNSMLLFIEQRDTPVIIENIQVFDTSKLVISGPAEIEIDENKLEVAKYEINKNQVTWQLSGVDANAFSISNIGKVTFKTIPDAENPIDNDKDNIYNFTVFASQLDKIVRKDITVKVNDVIDYPLNVFAKKNYKNVELSWDHPVNASISRIQKYNINIQPKKVSINNAGNDELRGDISSFDKSGEFIYVAYISQNEVLENFNNIFLEKRDLNLNLIYKYSTEYNTFNKEIKGMTVKNNNIYLTGKYDNELSQLFVLKIFDNGTSFEKNFETLINNNFSSQNEFISIELDNDDNIYTYGSWKDQTSESDNMNPIKFYEDEPTNYTIEFFDLSNYEFETWGGKVEFINVNSNSITTIEDFDYTKKYVVLDPTVQWNIRYTFNEEAIGFTLNNKTYGPKLNETNIISYPTNDVALFKFSNLGEEIWRQQVDGLGDDDYVSFNNLFIKNNRIFTALNSIDKNDNFNTKILLLEWDTSGNVIKRFTCYNSYDDIYDICLDDEFNVYASVSVQNVNKGSNKKTSYNYNYNYNYDERSNISYQVVKFKLNVDSKNLELQWNLIESAWVNHLKIVNNKLISTSPDSLKVINFNGTVEINVNLPKVIGLPFKENEEDVNVWSSLYSPSYNTFYVFGYEYKDSDSTDRDIYMYKFYNTISVDGNITNTIIPSLWYNWDEDYSYNFEVSAVHNTGEGPKGISNKFVFTRPKAVLTGDIYEGGIVGTELTDSDVDMSVLWKISEESNMKNFTYLKNINFTQNNTYIIPYENGNFVSIPKDIFGNNEQLFQLNLKINNISYKIDEIVDSDEVYYYLKLSSRFQSTDDNNFYTLTMTNNDIFTASQFPIPHDQSLVNYYIQAIITVTSDKEIYISNSQKIENVDDKTNGLLGILGKIDLDETIVADISNFTDDDGKVTFSEYQWEISTDNKNYKLINGAKSPAYKIPCSKIYYNKFFRVRVTTTDPFNNRVLHYSDPDYLSDFIGTKQIIKTTMYERLSTENKILLNNDLKSYYANILNIDKSFINISFENIDNDKISINFKIYNITKSKKQIAIILNGIISDISVTVVKMIFKYCNDIYLLKFKKLYIYNYGENKNIIDMNENQYLQLNIEGECCESC